MKKENIKRLLLCVGGIMAGLMLGAVIFIEKEKEPVVLQEQVETKPETEKERKAREEQARIEYETAKSKWMAENPSVDLLFEPNRQYDKEYVIEYIRNHEFGGNCALVWRPDVMCWDFDAKLIFPTSRVEIIY